MITHPEVFMSLRLARQFSKWTWLRSPLSPLEMVWRSRAAHITRTFNRLFAR